ncbi:unnamed protein product [Enterobius vermicularis]|uniref:ZZ-type domain-containing protein n=1 Tax=Enterobius vermicularis TaxID=51028 RepID=A0A0N4VNT6_ENTVE|nr:unnamed protein product [Enterobius vermicularis]
MWNRSDVIPSTANDMTVELQTLIDEMRLQDFDSIRFATYRAACKLRFIQKRTNVHMVDIWNIIESFRENALNGVPVDTQVKISRLELLLTTIFHNLNKRLPNAQHIDTDKSISLLLSFLVGAYDRLQSGRLTVFSVKIALATICAGKLVDKLRCIVNLNTFLDVIMNDSCPPCLMWLPLLHRMASVEHVYHPVTCDACQASSFMGFRYKCQRCTNYQLCQQCFWRGRTSSTHSNEHEMKEYSSYKSPTKQLAHSIHKSLRCVPPSSRSTHPIFPERPQRPLDLTNVVPLTPSSARRQLIESSNDWSSQLLPGQFPVNGLLMDDEHKLIARYSAKLAGRTQYPLNLALKEKDRYGVYDEVNDERAMIARLEEENEEMLREMEHLKQQELDGTDDQLSELRERKAQLEEKMHKMQQTRRQLMQQLESLMLHLNVCFRSNSDLIDLDNLEED